MSIPGTASNEPTLPEQPAWTVTEWEQIARHLFDALDDIDTASDMAKNDNAAYRALIGHIHGRRFRVAQTDGYRVVFDRLPEPTKP